MQYIFHRQVANYKPNQIHDLHIGLYPQRSPMLNPGVSFDPLDET